jgi:hypothetical protein
MKGEQRDYSSTRLGNSPLHSSIEVKEDGSVWLFAMLLNYSLRKLPIY